MATGLRNSCRQLLILVITSVTVVTSQENADKVRCFCNLPACVSKGYMCKSDLGACFSDLGDTPPTAAMLAPHGCVDMLDRKKQEQCGKSLILCCNKDMCNHVDGPDMWLHINESFPESKSNEGLQMQPKNAHLPASYASGEVWFKAATIAVPICGTVILFVLIAAAVRILRKDSIEQMRKVAPPLIYSYQGKEPLLVHHQYAPVEKNVQQMRHMTGEKHLNNCDHSNLFNKNINLSTSENTNGSELQDEPSGKMYSKEKLNFFVSLSNKNNASPV